VTNDQDPAETLKKQEKKTEELAKLADLFAQFQQELKPAPKNLAADLRLTEAQLA